MKNIVSVKSNKPVVSTFDLYKKMGYKEHRKLKEVINSNIEYFEADGLQLDMHISKPISGSTGGRPTEAYLLNIDHLILLFMLAKNTPETVKAKCEFYKRQQNATCDLSSIFDIVTNMDVECVPVDSYVYVAKEAISGRYKIGISKHPEARIKQLNVGNPEQLELIHAYLAVDGYKSEQLAHDVMSQYNLRGEWFADNMNIQLLPSYSGAN